MVCFGVGSDKGHIQIQISNSPENDKVMIFQANVWKNGHTGILAMMCNMIRNIYLGLNCVIYSLVWTLNSAFTGLVGFVLLAFTFWTLNKMKVLPIAVCCISEGPLNTMFAKDTTREKKELHTPTQIKTISRFNNKALNKKFVLCCAIQPASVTDTDDSDASPGSHPEPGGPSWTDLRGSLCQDHWCPTTGLHRSVRCWNAVDGGTKMWYAPRHFGAGEDGRKTQSHLNATLQN